MGDMKTGLVFALLLLSSASGFWAQQITDADWQRLFSSEGYVRLKQRESAMKRPWEDEEFKNFLLSEVMAERSPALEETLARWKRADVTAAARLALAYLPKDARIRAKIYPVIKPRDNSSGCAPPG
jgi:hypothetical protein